MPRDQEVLVVPRSYFSGQDRFVDSAGAKGLIRNLADSCRWMPRREAEESIEWVQPIPVALMMSRNGEYCILRRTRETRADLGDRLTLVVGGHVDREDSGNLPDLLERTVKRELDEEVGVETERADLLGLVIDNSSVLSSRHVAFLFLVSTDEDVQTSAPEEFAKKSKYSGTFIPVRDLVSMRKKFDPWSLVVIEDYLAPSEGLRINRQPRLPLPITE